MAQAYSNPKRASDPHALPDLEVFQTRILRCPHCEAEYPNTEGKDVQHSRETTVDESCCHLTPLKLTDEWGWWYWYCQIGCLPDSDPIGPFGSESEALADAQGSADDDEGLS